MSLLREELVPAREGRAWVVKRGERIRFVDVEGGQIGDLVVFNADNIRERFNQSRTRSQSGKNF